MIIKWYNRDEFSDQDMRHAKSVAHRLLPNTISVQLPPVGSFPIKSVDESWWAKDLKEENSKGEAV